MGTEAMMEAALGYAEMGFAVFPCEPGGKRPACEHGCKEATIDPDRIERWWSRGPAYNVGLSTEGLLIVDIDGKDNPWLRSLGERNEDLMGCPAAWTPRGGRHLFFRQPAGRPLRNTTGAIAPMVDTRGNGGYVVAAPSNREGGGGYRWFAERELERMLPEPPAWLLDLLHTGAKGSPSTRTNDVVPSNPIPSGQRNQALASLAGSVRRIGGGLAEIDALLQQTNCDRCCPPLDPIEVRKIAESVARYEPDQVATIAAEGSGLFAEEEAEGCEEFPQELLYPPGLIERVMDHNLDGAFREQPILALGGALALLATLTGRKVQDDRGTRTNAFILSVAASGSGKERARVVNKDLLHLAGGQQHIGPERAASATGIVSALTIEPSLLLQFDEFGRYLKAATSKTAGAHLSEVTTTLMRLFSSAGSVFLGDAYADNKRNTSIDQPHAVLYGTTVPGHLYESLTIDSISDGFMSRLLIFESEDEAPRYCRRAPKPPPQSLVDEVRAWIDEKPAGGNLSGQHPAPRVLLTSEGAEAVFEDLLDRCWEREKDKTSPYRSLWTRCVEKARKLALLHACSRRAPEIDADAAEWGCRLSEHLTRKLASVGREWVSETPHQANCQRVYRWLADRGGGVSKRDLARSMRHLKRQDREAVLSDLIEFGLIAIDTHQTGGRPSEVINVVGGLLSHPEPPVVR